jgi:hypothetical protein
MLLQTCGREVQCEMLLRSPRVEDDTRIVEPQPSAHSLHLAGRGRPLRRLSLEKGVCSPRTSESLALQFVRKLPPRTAGVPTPSLQYDKHARGVHGVDADTGTSSVISAVEVFAAPYCRHASSAQRSQNCQEATDNPQLVSIHSPVLSLTYQL